MTISTLIQLALASVISCCAINLAVTRLIDMGIRKQQIPRFWTGLLLGVISTLPSMLLALLIVGGFKADFEVNRVFSTLSYDVLFLLPLLGMFRPFHYSNSAARLEIPLLFAICAVFMLFCVDEHSLGLSRIVPLGIIFLMFCYDFWRMLELGDYQIKTEVKESRGANLLFIFAAAVVFALADVLLVIDGNIFLGLAAESFYQIILQLAVVVLICLPSFVSLMTWLKHDGPAELFVSATVTSDILISTLVLPIAAFFVQINQLSDNFMTIVCTLAGLGLIWIQVTKMRRSSRNLSILSLVIFAVMLYSQQ